MWWHMHEWIILNYYRSLKFEIDCVKMMLQKIFHLIILASILRHVKMEWIYVLFNSHEDHFRIWKIVSNFNVFTLPQFIIIFSFTFHFFQDFSISRTKKRNSIAQKWRERIKIHEKWSSDENWCCLFMAVSCFFRTFVHQRGGTK